MHRVRFLALALLAAVTVAGCGGSAGSTGSGTDSAAKREQVANGPARKAKAQIGPTGTAPVHRTRPGPVPILMYHVVGNVTPDQPYPELWVSPDLFARQMKALKRAGYHGVTLDAVLANWDHGAPLPRKPIVISFDDGYYGQSHYAAPVLRRLGWPGVLNLALHNLGHDGISATRVRGLIADGWEIDSHTLTHPDLTTLSPGALRRELVGSRRAIKRRFGVPVNAFCYPAGRYDAEVVQAVRAAGYRAATTVEPGYATPASAARFVLPRVRVNGGESPDAVLASLRSAAP